MALARKTINQEVYNIQFLEMILEYIAENAACLNVPSIAIYYFCYQALTAERNELYFQQLRQKISLYQSQFPPNEMRDIYFVAINYCIKKLNTGVALYIREAFELYRLSLEKGYLLEDGVMPESTFSNIVTLAIKLKEYEWAKFFLDKHREQLKMDFQQPLFHYSLAKLFYEEQQLALSMQQLALVETKASFLFLGARTLQIKICYEIQDFGLLEHLLESLRVYLQRRTDLGYRRENYENLIRFMRQLMKWQILTREEKKAWREQVEQTMVFTEKAWYLQQLK